MKSAGVRAKIRGILGDPRAADRAGLLRGSVDVEEDPGGVDQLVPGVVGDLRLQRCQLVEALAVKSRSSETEAWLSLSA